jgi:hypothetical protein
VKKLFQQPVALDPVSPVVEHGKRFVVADEAADGNVTVGMVGMTGVAPTIGRTFMVGTAAAELTPRLLISVDPNGSPVRAAPPTVLGDVEVGVEEEVILLEPEPHIPDRPEVSSMPEVVDMLDVVDIPGVPDAIAPDVAAVAAVAAPIPPPS